jgi:DNA invertase Pin-like site-specific DNA recombinase
MGDYRVGMYLRLSKDDLRAGESASIENQRILLTKHIDEKGWKLEDSYIDDGWSGTNFQRPAFQRMMQDVQNKRINLLLVKDLSRIGRNYLEVGRLTEETLPALGCRFIALNDSVDTQFDDNDMAVYRNLFNEFYSKDTSKKVRAVKKSLMERGLFLGTYAPFGYMKDPKDKHRLIIDNETAPIVRRMFQMRASGHSFRSIATTFNAERVTPPRDMYYNRKGTQSTYKTNNLWSDTCVKVILRNEVYIGHMVQGKRCSQSYKTHKLVPKPEEQWIRVRNTHEPLIALEVWETAYKLDKGQFKPRKLANGERNMFVGLLKCGDCGFNMKLCRDSKKKKDGSVTERISFICGNYARSGKTACTVHTIYENVLTELLLTTIRNHAKLVTYDEKRVTDNILQTKNQESVVILSTCKSELRNFENRLTQLEGIMKTLYEDRISGIVTDGVFKTLMTKYEHERAEKSEAIEIAKQRITQCERERNDVDAWTKTIRKYTNIETLSADILIELIDRIEIFGSQIIDGKRVCRIKIVYRFVGDISTAFRGNGGEADE